MLYPERPGPRKNLKLPGHAGMFTVQVALVRVAKKQNHHGMVPRVHGCHVAFKKRGPGPGLFEGELVSPLPRTRTPPDPRKPPAPGPAPGGPLAEAKPKMLLGFDAIGPSSAAPGRGGDPPAIPALNLKCRRRRRRGMCDALAPQCRRYSPPAASLQSPSWTFGPKSGVISLLR